MSGYIGTTPVPQATQHREAFTANADQTTFATAGYTVGFIDVWLNGVKLAAADVTVTNGSDIVLASAAAANDIIEYVAFVPFNAANQTFTGATVINSLNINSDGATVTGIKDEDNMASNDANKLATQQSIKAYVDAQVTAQDLDFQGDSGGALNIDLDSETLDIAGGTNITTAGSGNTVTVNIAPLDEDNMASNSATQVASQQSIKAYVDSTVAATNEVVEDSSPQLGGDLASNGNDILMADNDKAIFGTGSDLQIYHDGSDSFIKDAGTGRLLFLSNEIGFLKSDGNEFMLRSFEDGRVSLLHDSAEKLTTTSTGIDVTGVITTDGLTTSADINFGDSDKAIFGAGSDLQIYHDGSNSYISNSTGDLTVDVAGDIILDADGGDVFFSDAGTATGKIRIADGDLQIRSLVSNKDITFEGNDGGSIIEAMRLDMSDAGTATFNHDVNMGDLCYLKLGAGNDLELSSDGTNGKVFVQNGNLTLDVAGDITLDAAGADVFFSAAGNVGSINMASNNLTLSSLVSNADLIFKGNDGGSTITALTFDMSEAGAATFNSALTTGGNLVVNANVGIGIANPTEKLTVVNSSSGIVGRFTNNTNQTLDLGVISGSGSAGGVYYNNANSGYHAFQVGGTEKARLDASGNLGIGTVPSGYLTSGYNLRLNGGSQTYLAFNNDTHTTQVLGGFVIGNDSSAARITQRENNRMIFATNNAEQMTIHGDGIVSVRNGIELGSGLDSTAANILDDYEEGTWTPTLSGYNSATLGLSASAGHYTKIGDMVFASGRITVNALNSVSASYMLLGGLPFNHQTARGGDTGSINFFSGFENVVSSLAWDISSTGTVCWLTGVAGNSSSTTVFIGSNYFGGNEVIQFNLIYKT